MTKLVPTKDAPKSLELLNSFVHYCIRNPELRFWQALRNWSGYSFIYASDATPFNIADNHLLKDTYYWEKNEPYVS